MKEHRTCADNFFYYPDPNEEGWKNADTGALPGEPPGYAPQLDRDLIDIKVGSLLHDLCDNQFIYVSNGSGADYLTNEIAARCTREGRFDQYSILLFILESVTPDHARFWKEIGDGVVSGNDPRTRCDCGALATVYADKKDWCSPCYRAPIENCEEVPF